MTPMNDMTHRICKGPCKRTLPRGSFQVKEKRNGNRWPFCEDCLPDILRERRRRNDITTKAREARQRTSRFVVDREKVPQLSVAPLRAWLETVPGECSEVAAWLGTSERCVFRWRSGESLTTSLDLVDRCFCNAGIPEMLRELWPDLYVFGEELAA